jgi:hypothetical protein
MMGAVAGVLTATSRPGYLASDLIHEPGKSILFKVVDGATALVRGLMTATILHTDLA